MSDPLTFTSSVTLPDGRSIYISIDIPQGHPSLDDQRDLLDYTEYAQMGASHVLRVIRSGDHHRARRRVEEAEEIDEMNRQIVAKLNGEAPF